MINEKNVTKRQDKQKPTQTQLISNWALSLQLSKSPAKSINKTKQ